MFPNKHPKPPSSGGDSELDFSRDSFHRNSNGVAEKSIPDSVIDFLAYMREKYGINPVIYSRPDIPPCIAEWDPYPISPFWGDPKLLVSGMYPYRYYYFRNVKESQ